MARWRFRTVWNLMNTRKAFAKALKTARKARALTQEDFAGVSGRTYLSALERGLKSPTLEKIEALSEEMGISPLTLMTLTYIYASGKEASALWKLVER